MRVPSLLLAVACVASTVSAESIRIDPSERFQTMEGFGASLTDSSAWLINNRMSVSQRTSLMSALFHPTNGAGLSFLRQPMGASDYSTVNYTYNDLPPGQTDHGLSGFTIARERTTLVPLLQAAKSLNPDLRLMGTPWSPPAWLKTGGQINGGRLINSEAAYETYANYFVKYVQAYRALGLDIDYVSMQNEPWLEINYPSMRMDPAEAARLIRKVGPKFAAAGIDTKILGWDHNWDDAMHYVPALLADAAARPYIDGIAFHGYAGDVSAQTQIQNQFPDKGIYFTELTAVQGTSFAGDLMWSMRNLIVGGTRNHAKSIVRWNLALDENGAPYLNGPTSLCRGMVTINSNSGAVTFNEEFYSTAHLSRFVKVGAERIASDSERSVAFVNPDGSTALVAYNDKPAPETVVLRWNGRMAKYTLPSQSVATLTWTSGSAVAVYLTTGDKSKLLAREPDIAFATTRWSRDGLGDWHDAGNWSIAAPNGVGDVAVLGPANTAPRTIYADQPLTLGRLQIDSEHTYAIVGAARLTMDRVGANAAIDVVRGDHLINLPLTIASDTTITVDAGATLRVADPVTVRAGASLLQGGPGTVLFTSHVTIEPAARLGLLGAAAIDALSLAPGARVTLDATSRSVLHVGALRLAAGSSLDLGSSALLLSGFDAATVTRWVEAGMLFSGALDRADGAGRILSFSAGDVADSASALQTVLRDGQRLVLGALLGDADLSGTVDSADLQIILSHFGASAHGPSGWFMGDVDLDGTVGAADLEWATSQLGRSLLPEPSAIWIMSCLALVRQRKRTRHN